MFQTSWKRSSDSLGKWWNTKTTCFGSDLREAGSLVTGGNIMTGYEGLSCWQVTMMMVVVAMTHPAACLITDVCPLFFKCPNGTSSHLHRSLDVTWRPRGVRSLWVSSSPPQTEIDPGRGSELRWSEETFGNTKWHCLSPGEKQSRLLQQRCYCALTPGYFESLKFSTFYTEDLKLDHHKVKGPLLNKLNVWAGFWNCE